MHRAKILLILLFFLLTYSGQAETFWKIRTESGEEILLRIDINNTSKTFVASTRKDAIKDIAGFFAYNLAHAAGKLKYPEIVHIEGKTNQEKDSLKLDGVFYYTDKKYEFQASISGINFLGKYIDNRKRVHRLLGFKQPDGRPIHNYMAILNQTIALSEKYLANPDWLKTGEWNDFKEATDELKAKVADDYELGALVMWYSRKFSFSPYEISKPTVGERKQEANVQFIKPHIGLLNGNLLPNTAKQKDSLATVISKQSVTKLVLDLRGRLNITPIQVKLILEYLSPKDYFAGIWLTRKWNNLHSSFNRSDVNLAGIKPLPEGDRVTSLKDTDGYLLDVKTDRQSFGGEIVVLTDNRTSRLSEVLAGVLQQEKLATLVGQKTAAQPFVVEKIKMENGFELQIPVAVFISRQAPGFEKKSLTPDILVEKDNALNYLLKKL